MCDFRWRALIVGIVEFVILVIVAISLWFGGYINDTKWNYNAIETNATVTGNAVTDDDCSCGKGCDYICYDGTIYFTYQDRRNNTYSGSGIVYDGYDYSRDVQTMLNTNYPINYTFIVYYNKLKPSDFGYSLKPAHDFYIAFFVIISIGIAIALGWGIFEAVHFIRKT